MNLLRQLHFYFFLAVIYEYGWKHILFLENLVPFLYCFQPNSLSFTSFTWHFPLKQSKWKVQNNMCILHKWLKIQTFCSYTWCLQICYNVTRFSKHWHTELHYYPSDVLHTAAVQCKLWLTDFVTFNIQMVGTNLWW